METFADTITQTSCHPLFRLYTAQAHKPHLVPKFLDIETTWTYSHDISWSVRKCAVAASPSDLALTLIGEEIRSYQEADYLIVSLSSADITYIAVHNHLVNAA